MKYPSQYILPLFIFSVLITASGISSNFSLNPLEEKISLENIELKPFSPKVILHSSSHNFSSLDSYLKSHEVSLCLERDSIIWKIKIPAVLAIPNIYPGDFQNELSFFQKFQNYPIQSEVVQNTLTSKNFLLDVIFSLQKHKEYKEIQSIFHPDNTISTDLLEKTLSNSLEFKVLSHTDMQYSKNTTPIKKYTIDLCDSIIGKQKELLKPSFTLDNIFLSPLKNMELSKNFSGKNLNVEKEKTSPIILQTLSIPSIIFQSNISYFYDPKIESEDLNFLYPSPSKWNLHKLNLGEGPIKDDFYLSKLDEKSISLNQCTLTYSPKAVSIGHESTHISSFFKIETKSSPQILPEFKTIKETEKKPLIVVKNPPIEKHLFIDSKLDSTNLTKFHPLDAIKITKANIYKNYYPHSEDLLIEEEISIVLFLNQINKNYSLFKNEQVNSTNIDLVSKNYPFDFNGKSFIPNKHLKKMEFSFENYPVITNLAIKKSPSNTIKFAKNENIVTKFSFEYPNLKPKDNAKVSYFKDPYPLSYDKRITFNQSSPGKLEPGIIQSKRPLFFLKQLDNFTSFAAVSFAQKMEESYLTKVKNIPALKQSSSLNDTALLKDDTHPPLTKIKSNSFHPFVAPISKVSYSDSIEQAHPSLSPINQIVGVKSPLSLNLVDSYDNSLQKPLYFNAIVPLKAEEIHLEHQLKLKEGEFKGNISLPKVFSVNDKSSFFLNPMLLLIHSNTYDITMDITDTAYKINRERRKTQNSLFNWPTLEDLQTDSLAEAFTLDTRLLSEKSNPSNEFACTIKSYEKNIIQALPIHLLYILDTSKSIEPHRFKIFKEAIVKSIDQLEVDAKYNIAIVFKGKIELLHKESLLATPASKGFTKRFLRKIEQSENITFKDISDLIEKEKKLATLDITHRMCLLLSDGKFASNLRIDREELNHLSGIESGNFSFYTASVSDNNNKGMLSFLSKLNHGFSLYTRTHTTFARKFCTLVSHLQHPIMHDIRISFPDESNSKIYLADKISPILLADKGMTFYGKSETNSSSRIFIQGKAGNRWINILTELPFATARKGRYNLQKNLASQKTFLSLYSFLKTGDEKNISQAKEYQGEYNLTLPLP